MSSASEDVLVKVENYIGHITLNRTERANSITPSMVQSLSTTFDEFSKNEKVRVIVLSGSGKYFCSGMDLGFKNQQQLQSQLASGEAANAALSLFNKIRKCPKPVISKINGPAIGGGFGIVFCTDVRIVLESATFSFAEVKSGLVPALISSFIVPQMSSYLAKELMITGRKITAQEAFKLGLVTAVAKNVEELNNLTEAYVKECLGNASGAMATVKQLVQYLVDHNEHENEDYVKTVFNKMFNKEALYGITCTAAQKKPDWNTFASKL